MTDFYNPTGKGLQSDYQAIFSLTETELACDYDTIEALCRHPRLARFIAWVAKRPPEFHSKTPGKRRQH